VGGRISTFRAGLAIDSLRSTEGLERAPFLVLLGALLKAGSKHGVAHMFRTGGLEALRGPIPEPDGPALDHSGPIEVGGRPRPPKLKLWDTCELGGGIPESGTIVVLRSPGVGGRSRDVCVLSSPEPKPRVGAGFLVTTEVWLPERESTIFGGT